MRPDPLASASSLPTQPTPAGRTISATGTTPTPRRLPSPATSPTPSALRTPTPAPGRTARATRRSTTSSPPTPQRPGLTPSTRPTIRPTCSATRAPSWSRQSSALPTPSSDPRRGRASMAGSPASMSSCPTAATTLGVSIGTPRSCGPACSTPPHDSGSSKAFPSPPNGSRYSRPMPATPSTRTRGRSTPCRPLLQSSNRNCAGRSAWLMPTEQARNRLGIASAVVPRFVAVIFPVAGQDGVELVAGADVELDEDLVQVVLDRARAHEKVGSDRRVGQAIAGQPDDLDFPGSELGRHIGRAFTYSLAGREQLARGSFGEPVSSHGGEHVVRGAQLLAGIDPPVLPAQPLPE